MKMGQPAGEWPHAGAVVSGVGTEAKAALSQRETSTLPVAHTCAGFDILQVGPHGTATHATESAKAADGCGTL